MKNEIDDLDRALLKALGEDARKSWRELAEQLGVSAPTIRDRVGRLQDIGVLRGFVTELDPVALGYTLEAIVRFKAFPGKLQKLEQQIREADRIVQCDKITGEDAFVARLLLRSIAELDPLLEGFTDKASTNTAIVKASPVRMRQPPL
ncbi:Lrp/AsnC family transcriptional regulator [Kiloniella sp. b19]|uniref:Lrp/AsnC family transcriptional regulator n=1 Tax=Kiloniella sp. GXU_MW_B19 TaxID=3141326 RepID=UPI0031DCCCD5